MKKPDHCFWDEEIYCFANGRTTTGFFSFSVDRPADQQYEAIFCSESLGLFGSEGAAKTAVEQRVKQLLDK